MYSCNIFSFSKMKSSGCSGSCVLTQQSGLRQKECREFEACLGYRVRSGLKIANLNIYFNKIYNLIRFISSKCFCFCVAIEYLALVWRCSRKSEAGGLGVSSRLAWVT